MKVIISNFTAHWTKNTCDILQDDKGTIHVHYHMPLLEVETDKQKDALVEYLISEGFIEFENE